MKSDLPESVRKELAALAAMPESEIDVSDLPPLQAQDWVGAERGKFYRPLKQQLPAHRCHGLVQEPGQTPRVRCFLQPCCNRFLPKFALEFLLRRR